MRFSSSHLLLVFCLLFLAGGWAAPARADVVFAARSISVPGVKLSTVTVRLSDRADGGIHLQLSAKQADVAAMGWRKVGLALDGDLQRDARMRWILDGQLQLRGAPGAALSDATLRLVTSETTNTIQVDIEQGKAKASAVRELAERENLDLTASYAYGDSTNDVPILSEVGFPCAINPDRRLRRHAQTVGWPIREFRGRRRAARRSANLASLAGLAWVAGLVVRTIRRSARL